MGLKPQSCRHTPKNQTLHPFLPPANEVWGKVIFSVACVKNSVHNAGRYGQQASGMHPTGMQSCRRFIFCSVGFHTCCYFAGEVDRFPVVGREARACAERCQLLPEVHG